MVATNKPTVDLTTRENQLLTLQKNVNYLREREAKYEGNAPPELINQIDDHLEAIDLVNQAMAGQLSDAELEEKLKPLALAFHNGQVINITAETYVAGDQIIQKITNIAERALTAAEGAKIARSIAAQRLAEGVRGYAQRLAEIASDETDADSGGPYKGLLAYRLSDAELFFGRERAIAGMLEQLQRGRLTILHAESGAGKSSLLQAGIANRLLGRGHLPVYLRPYDQSPSLAIKRVFLPNLGQKSSEVSETSELYSELANTSLRDFLRQVTGVLGPEAILYLMLDQFEEVFTLLDEEPRTEFVGELADCLEDESLNVGWVLALRTEFFGNLANFRPRIRNPFENDYRLNRLNLIEARTVITEPAARHGISFEPELVGRLLTDLHDEQSDEIAPPQIQLVCSALYNILLEQRAPNPDLPPIITMVMYEEEGRAQGILRGHLNRVLRRALSQQEREAARQLLIALVSSDQRRIRRTKSDLAATLATYLTSAMSLDDLLEQLIESRLLNVEEDEQADEPAYELAHDLLLTEIELDPETQARKAAEELLKQEVGTFKRYGTLLSADKFDIINSQRQFLTPDEDAAELLRLSLVARRRAQLQKYGAMAVVVLLIIGAAVAIALIQARSAKQQAIAAERARNAEATAVAERDRAEQELLLSTSNELVAQSQTNLDLDPDLSILLALQAIETAETTQAREMLYRAVQAAHLDRTLVGHTDFVESVAYAPNGSQLVTASDDGTVRVWDVDTGQEVTSLSGHEGTVWSAVFSPDGDQLATAGDDGSARLWEAASGQELLLLPHTGVVSTVAYRPDGKQLATGGEDGMVHVWDPGSGEAIVSFQAHNGWVTNLAYSPDGARIATASDDETVRVWDATSGEELFALLGHSAAVNSVVFHPAGVLLATAGSDGTVRLWETQTGKEVATLTGHVGPVWSVAYSRDGSRLASVGEDGTARLWEATFGKQLLELTGHTADVAGVAFSPDGRHLATAGADSTARIWRVASPDYFFGHADFVNGLTYSPDGARLASAGSDDRVRVWDTRTGRELQSLPHDGRVMDVAYHPISSVGRLATASQDGTVRVWNANCGEVLLTLHHTDFVNGVAYSPDGTTLASASSDGTARIWDAELGLELVNLRHDEVVVDVVYRPDGTGVATVSQDGLVRIWDAEAGQLVVSFSGNSGFIWGVAYSPDGQRLATAGDDGTARVWAAESGQALLTLKGHKGAVRAVAFSPDGMRLATASDDRTTIVWDASSGEMLLTLADHTNGVQAVVFSPDGQWLVTGSQDWTIRAHPLDPDEFLNRARSRLSRWWTPEECVQFIRLVECPPKP